MVEEVSVIYYPVSRIVRAFLIEEGVGVSYEPFPSDGWPIATEACPKEPPNVITIYEEAAIKKFRTLANGVQEDPVVVIEVRSSQPEPGQYKAKEIQEAMDGLLNWTWEGGSSEYGQTVLFSNARRSRGIFPLGIDENGLWKRNLEYALVIQSIA